MVSLNYIKDDKLNIYMLMLAVYPVLNLYYFANTSLYLPQVITMILAIYSVCKSKPIFRCMPLIYIICWVYVALHDIFFVNPFKITKLLPGGINFFLFSIGWAMFASNFDAEKLRKYVNYVFIFAALLFLYQNFVYYVFGQSTSVILPISNNLNYGEFTFSDLQIHQKNNFNGRFSSIFAEPSYWAQYCVVALCLELFCNKNISKLFTKTSILISIVLLTIQSGVGILCFGLLIIIKLWQFIFINKDKSKIIYLIMLIPFAFYAVYLYVSSDIGQALIERGNDISSVQGEGARSAFLRLFYGWEYLASLSANTLLLGVNEIVGMSVDGDSFFNCVTYFILLHGIIGFTLLFIFYFKSARTNILSTATALVLLSIAMMEAIYLNPTMLICTVIIVASSKTQSRISL